MDNSSFSETPVTLSEELLENFSETRSGIFTAEDIPEAVREAPSPEVPGLLTRLSKQNPFMLGLAGLGAIALLILPITVLITKNQASTAANSANGNGAINASVNSRGHNNTNNSANTQDSNSAKSSDDPDVLLGHLKYQEAPQTQLQTVTPDGSIKLRKAAAEKFLAMSDAARAAGVTLVPLSGFRSQQEQNQLFFDVKAERGQAASERASVSAPPGHSEHHTGYAIDIGDGDRSELDLNPAFDQTRAYQWLKQNAPYYSFELSFPKNNPQGVSYEPWHWRFVGDRDSLETFYRARSLRETKK